MKTIGPVPDKCHYRRCWCTWWIVPDKETRILTCTLCGVQKIRAENSDFAAVGLTVLERDASPDDPAPRAIPVPTKPNADDTRLW